VTYESTVAADVPAHWWRLADPGGIIAVDHATSVVKVPLFVPSSNQAPYLGMCTGGACTARGVASSLFNVSNAIAVTNLWSIEVWAWQFFAGGATVCTLENDPAGARLSVRTEANGNVTGFISGVGTAVRGGVISIEAWHHFVLTYDHVNLKLYVDGALAATTAMVTSTVGNYSPLAGQDQGVGGPLTGFVEDFAYYAFVLSGAQVLSHFNAADQLGLQPVYLGGGSFDISTGSSGGSSGDLDRIYRAVHQDFP
jgi:Concanavalin A-like lectin/glucanases superfamily